MTISHLRRCAWCGAGFKASGGPGRPASFCRRSHRQRAYEARTLAARHGLGPDDALMSRRLLTELQDGLYLLQSAMEDVEAKEDWSTSPAHSLSAATAAATAPPMLSP